VSSGRNLGANFLGRPPERVKPGSVRTPRAVINAKVRRGFLLIRGLFLDRPSTAERLRDQATDSFRTRYFFFLARNPRIKGTQFIRRETWGDWLGLNDAINLALSPRGPLHVRPARQHDRQRR